MSQNPLYIDRPPRIQPELPLDQVRIPAPPQKQPAGWIQLVQVGLPMLTIIGYVLITMVGGTGQNPLIMIPMALAIVASTGFAIYLYLHERQQRQAEERAYMERLFVLNKEMNVCHDMQRRFYTFNYPDQETTFRIVQTARDAAQRNPRTLRTDVRLWERRTSDQDFGVIRLGMGTLPSTVIYELDDLQTTDDPQARAAIKLRDDARFVSNIPVIINLRQPPNKNSDSDAKEQEKRAESKEAKEEKDKRTPVSHAIGIAGTPSSVYQFARALVAHYVVLHPPSDAKLFILASHKKEWAWMEKLPHCGDDENNPQTFFIDSIPPRATETSSGDEEETPQVRFLEGIRKILAQRKLQMQESDERDQEASREANTLPQLLLVVDLLDAKSNQDLQLKDLEADAAISILLQEGNLLGAAVIFLVPQRSQVPSACHSVIEIEETTPSTTTKTSELERSHFRYTEIGVNSFRYVGEADVIHSSAGMNDLAARLSNVRIRESFGANIPGVVPFLDLMSYPSLQPLTLAGLMTKIGGTEGWWRKSTEAKRADWLRARVGKMSGNKPRTLHFSAKRDGVHGMIAGSTGSGKSELLISLITAMACTYDPSVLNFVLVDYKGGGAFKGFENLPHCVDIITNLAGEGVTRMFTAINAELQRRQKLNVDTNTKNIVDYRNKGLHETREPYPFLFIIIDEFAEMIADRAEYKTQLETITRVGRAQGVSLLLAAQRPSGVTDQMRSNIKFRVCLRVETSGESREMLRRTDAAFLPSGIPGRGFLQVGNEDIDLIQVAYAGDKYIDPTRSPRVPVIWTQRKTYDASQDQEPPELYRAIVAALDKLADENNVPEQRAPWPEFLPTHFALSSVLIGDDAKSKIGPVKPITSERYLNPQDIEHITLGEKREPTLSLNPSINKWITEGSGWVEHLDWDHYAFRPIVGLVDNPYAARQLPLVIDLPRGHTVIFGASGWGKTTFLRTLVVSLAATHSPNHAQFYILDLGGRNFEAFKPSAEEASNYKGFPHVGAVISPDEEGYKERVEQLLRELGNLIEERKKIFSDAGKNDLLDYNKSHANDPLPGIVVVMDNFAEFKDTFDTGDDQNASAMDRFVDLARESKPYGVYFIIAANGPNILSSQLYSIFTERLTLKLADAADYRVVLGAHVAEIGDQPGRGYVNQDRLALSFQIALPLDLNRGENQEPANERTELVKFGTIMQEYIERSGRKYKKPVRVEKLPKTALLKEILAKQHNLPLDEKFISQLKQITREKWRDSARAEKADWLKVTIGKAPGEDRTRTMHLEAKRDGVHGLVAGGTGAGKSELLMSLIVGLALNHDPSILNFVLVDYKGGGAFKPFEKLPHCVDSISNLNKNAVRRMFTAISAEMLRRQKLCTDTNTKDIIEYRRAGLHLTREPFPHLFVIIDEYAEMISDSPEFKDELESITRVGRSIGVNLLLASQKPIGVTDQMRANIKYRICLRVEEVDTSREMLRRSDAAQLPGGIPGRGYLQVGNENLELIQAAYTGETYAYWHPRPDGNKPKFYEVIVDLANELLQEERPRTPWPPFLPRSLTLIDPIQKAYLSAEAQEQLTLGRTDELAINPFFQEWLDGKGEWRDLDWGTQTLRAQVGIVDDPYNSRQLPLTVDFNKGHAVLFGGSGWGKTTLLRTLIASLATTHSPRELHAHILDLGGRNLEMLRELPHVGTIIMPDERGYEEQVQQLLRELNDLVGERKRMFGDAGVQTLAEFNRDNPQKLEPAILIVIDNFAEYIDTFGKAKENDPNNMLEALIALMRQSKSFGVHFIITADRLNVLSSKNFNLFTERLTLRLANADDYSTIVGGRINDVDEIQGRGYVRVEKQALAFQIALATAREERNPGDAPETIPAARPEAQVLRNVGREMKAAWKEIQARREKESGFAYREPMRIGALPTSSMYRQVVGKDFELRPGGIYFDDLKSAVQKRWEYNAAREHAAWLKVPLGIVAGNKIRTLNLEAKSDGVHGMIAGGTGSGKSELLMTLICGLALNYSPDILNFVLVDYKGGGAFKPFSNLPHCVDIVTNLNKSAVNRMFTSIDAEIRRRQKLNADTSTKDIVDYREKGFHLTHAPYPHLFIIIDEYSEMISDNQDYQIQLDSISRVGRAQGINLLLASQQPKGVTDQMRANIKYRICLRVEREETSMEMLRRRDANLLPNGLPGRGYVQVGSENLELIQVSWSGEVTRDDRPAPVEWTNHTRATTLLSSDDAPRFFDAVVKLTSELTNGAMARKPWPAFLPTNISLQSPLQDAKENQTFYLTTAVTDWLNGDTDDLWQGVNWREGAMRAVVGLVDDPVEAKQFPLEFDLSDQHLLVYGDSGWGKTSFLRSLIVSLASTHNPDELNVFVLDLGGRNFRALEGLPHVGAVIYADEETYEERLLRLLDRLERITDERLRVISDAQENTLYQYNQRFSDTQLPAILVVIDNFAALQENYELLVESTLLPLVRRSLAAGITFVMSANNVPSKLAAMFGRLVTFRQTNFDRYLELVGRGAVELDEIPGRGYIRLERRPMQFQAALSVGALIGRDGYDTIPEAKELREHLVRNMDLKWSTRKRPEPIQVLPQLIALRQVLDSAELNAAADSNVIEGVLGIRGTLIPATFDLKRVAPHFLIIGPPLSGKTTGLYNWVLSLAYRYSPSQVAFVLVDLQRRFVDYDGERMLSALPHVLATVYELDELESITKQLSAEFAYLAAQKQAREIFVVIDNFDEASEEIEEKREVAKELANLARRYGRDGLHFIAAGSSESGLSDLRRRIQAANFGIGLRTSASLDALRVMRTPAAVREKEMVIGRGFIVRSGVPSMIQLASPYVNMNDDALEGEFKEKRALDKWVEIITAKYPDAKATWRANPDADGAAASDTTGSSDKPKSRELSVLLQRMFLWETERMAATPDAKPIVMPILSSVDADRWTEKETLTQLVREAWRLDQKVRYSFDDSMISSFESTMDADSFLQWGRENLPSPNGHEPNSQGV